MLRDLLRRAFLVIPLGLATLAGCRDTDTTAPKFDTQPMLAQGDGGLWTVNSFVDPGDGTCDDANCTLREAIAAAASGDQVAFANTLPETIALSGEITIGKDLTINGGGRITLDAGGTSRVMMIPGVVISDPARIVTLDGLTLTNGSTSSNGGAIWIAGNNHVILRNTTISGNTAGTVGGGITIPVSSTVTLINSTVDGNIATGDGGGIHNAGAMTVVGSTISNNDAGNGGGIFNATTGSATIQRSTVSGNRETGFALSPGEGIFSQGNLTVISTTIANHKGSLNLGLVVSGTTTVANSIIGGCIRLSGTFTSLGNNLSDFSCLTFSSGPGDLIVPQAQWPTHVLDLVLKDNGGPTKTHALIARGLAVDAGRCPAETSDQRGFTRPVDDPTVPNVSDACDIGAYEAQGPLVAVADLMVSQTVDKSSVKQGDLLTYTVRVQNLGPQTAPNVVLTNVLSSGVTFVEARVNKGTTTAPPKGETGTVTWTLGDMANQANEAAEIVVTVLVKGRTTITNTATVSGNVSDPNPANNSAAITVSVVAGKTGGKKG